jgi:small redox-active disulfide protein 2
VNHANKTIFFPDAKTKERQPNMKIQILGTGCAKCNALTMATEKAAQMLDIQYELEKVTDLKQIMAFGVMATPALVVDGKLKVSGKVPAVDEIKTMLRPTGQ